MKNKKLLSILTTIAVVAGCLPGFVLADNDVVDAETNTEVTEETNSAEEPQSESYEVDESIASVSPAYANDTPEEGTNIYYIYRELVDGTVVETRRTVESSTLKEFRGGVNLSSGWYYVGSDTVIDSRVFMNSNNSVINLIIGDGVTLNCNDGIHVEEGATFNIYGQAADSGVLNSTISDTTTETSGQAGIGGDSSYNAGTINIYGGTINAEGASGAAGIGGGSGTACEEIRIYGGNVVAIGSGNCNIGCSAGFTLVYYYGGCITLPPTGSPHTNYPQAIDNMCVRDETGNYYYKNDRSVLYTGADDHTLTICPCQHSHFTDGVCDYCGFEMGDSAQFIGHAMRLTGEIGLQFYVKLPTNSSEGYYMTFEGQGMDPANQVELVADSAKTGVENSFYALINLSSIQMAESFIPTLHCPDGSCIQGSSYSAQDYIAWGKDNGSIDNDEREIIRALGDYGYFAQRYLSSLRSWTPGTDYAAMTVRGSDLDYSQMYDGFREWIEEKSLSGTFFANDYFSAATISLKFDSLVTLYVYLTPKEGVTIDASSIDAADGEVTRLSDGRFMISYPNLPITAFVNPISINYNNNPIAELSPLSYVYTMLGSDSVTADGKNMVCSLFRLFTGVVPTTDL